VSQHWPRIQYLAEAEGVLIYVMAVLLSIWVETRIGTEVSHFGFHIACSPQVFINLTEPTQLYWQTEGIVIADLDVAESYCGQTLGPWHARTLSCSTPLTTYVPDPLPEGFNPEQYRP